MRNTVRLSLLASVLVLNASAIDDLASMFKEGKVSGQVREFSVVREYLGTAEYTRRANAIGGYLKYETSVWNGLSLGGAFYTTNGFMLDDKANLREVDPTLLGKNNDSYSILGEAYLQYKNENTTFKGGRQKLDNPMMGSDDVRMMPNLFEAYLLTNTDLKDTTLTLAHVTKFAQGTFGRVYNASSIATGDHILSVTSGYSMTDSRDQVGQFVDMGTYAIGENTGGVSVASVTYTGIAGLKLQIWDYYAHDIMNAVYAEANYGWSYPSGVAPYVGVQYINERDIGSNSANPVFGLDTIESDFIAAKAGVKVANFDVYGAVSHNSKNDDAAVNGGTITPWGGMSAYTQGMVIRHMFMAGTDAWKLAGNYDWKNFGINLNTGVYYTSFDMDGLNGYSQAGYEWTATEAGFDMIYYPEAVKNLQVRFRGNFPREFKEAANGTTTSWSEYRFILNYNF